ncbi:protein RRP5 homolog [Chanos chanos]|uniref:Protein RRP5 homolog n=1 Tax=Chanos chanos TaxID=29144 RepID=A0A6J2VWH8_CHACN|nr:protein RRP5 homolog [Chanos chanos]
MASAEEDFPRGGTSKKASRPKVASHVEVDNLFETCEPEVKTKRKAGKELDDKHAKKQKTSSKEAGLKLNAVTNVEVLHLKNVKVGTLLLGCVKSVSDFDVVVGLPSGLTGYLPITNVSDSFTKLLNEQVDNEDSVEEVFSLPHLFSPGMLIRCVVSSLESPANKSIRVKLSVNPKEVNKGLSAGSLKPGMSISGCVESIEDHGYLIDIGVGGTKAFLPKQTAKDETKTSKRDLKVGQYVTTLLEEVKNNGRVVRLSVNPTAVNQACAETQHGWTLSNLIPGLLVKAHIKKVTPHGLIVEFLSSFSGVVDFLHINANEASSYNPGDVVKARVIYIDPTSRQVGLSLRRHLLPPGGSVLDDVLSERVGEVVNGCKMTVVHHYSGATIELPDSTVAFVYKNQMKEPNEEFNPNRLLAQPEHTCRITEYSPLEQIHMATLRQSIISVPFFRYQDLKLGQIVEGTVVHLQDYGMYVKITNHIQGLVPKIHLADIVLKNPEKKFSPGQKVKCRVLSLEGTKLALTNKKTLVNSTLPLFLSFADARVGRVSHGVIVAVRDFGCIVRFYGDVKGLVLTRELSSEPVLSPQSIFYVGQVVKVKVLKCDVENSKLLLSLKDVPTGDTEDPEKPQFDFEVGKVVEATVKRKLEHGLEVSILPEEATALLPMMHLSDHVSNCRLLWEALQEGDVIANLVCLNKTAQGITLSKKPLVKAALEGGSAVREFSDIQEGMQLIGWIKNILPYGAFVDFSHRLFGLAPLAAMSDKFISSTENMFQVGQTVVAKVTNIDEEKRRFLVSLKVSDMSKSEEENAERLIRGQLERKVAMEMFSGRGDSDVLQQLSSVSVGDKLKMTVREVKQDGSVSLASDQLSEATVLAPSHNAAGVNKSPGFKVTAVVLHVDPLTSTVYVSLSPKLVGKKLTLEKDSQHEATVQYVENEFAVISLAETGHLTVISTTSHLNETFRFKAEKLAVGRTLAATVTDLSSEGLGGLPLVTWDFDVKRARTISGSKGVKHKYKVGDVVTGAVKSIKPLNVLVTLPGEVTGSVHVTEVQTSPKVGSFPTSSLKVGSKVKARVIGGREVRSHKFLPISHPNFKVSIPELSLLPSKLEKKANLKSLDENPKLDDFQPGEQVICYVSTFRDETKCLEVCVTPDIIGTVELLAMVSDHKAAKRPQKLYKQGQALQAKVIGVSPNTPPRLFLSLTGMHKVEPGVVTLGMVRKIIPNVGLLVKLPFRSVGMVCIADLADFYTEKPLEQYKEGQIVKCCVVAEDKDKFSVSLRPSRTHPGMGLPVRDAEILSVTDLKVGQVIRGYLKSVGDQGIFIWLSRTVTGRVQFQHASNFFAHDPSVYKEHISQNALLTAKVLSVDEKNQVQLSLLPEDTGKPDVLPETLKLPLRLRGEEKEKRDKVAKKRKMKDSPKKEEPSEKKMKKTKKSKADGNDSGVEVYFREEEEESEEEKKKETSTASTGPARLQVSAGFSWDSALSTLKPAASANTHDSSDEEDEEEQNKPEKQSRKEKEQEKKAEEKRLSQLEAELMDPERRPDSAAAFERLLLSSPDSSLIWLQYMAFHLQATEIEQARAVAERALKTISFREEQEKQNVWVALLNLENMYGTEESLQKVFERAVQFCEPLPIYQQLADIYTKSDKIQEAENLYKSMIKRFRQEQGVWQSYGTFLIRQGKSDAASALLQRALQSLSTKEHVDLIAKFARLEFQYGDKQKAKSMFDKILTSYPKRTDLWSVFIDLMVKHGTQKEVRDLFDRVINLSVAVKRIKFFFKRYLEYEKKHGTPESVQTVKQKALEYVESKGADASS